MAIIEVLAHKGSTAKFTVAAGTRKEAEQAIADKLRSDTELIWTDDPDGVNVDCIWGNDVWRPRKRFVIEDQSAARPNGEGAK
jgi:hypothetical protein